MDDMLKHTIRSEIAEYMSQQKKGEDGVEGSVAAGRNSSSSALSASSSTRKDKQTEGRLSSLLSRIRSKRDNSRKPGGKKKAKKLQVKYQRYDPLFKDFKLVKPKERGGARFIDVDCDSVTSFSILKEKAEAIYFNVNDCNHFLEDRTECVTTLCDLSGLELDENENIWDYLKRTGELISKTTIILRSQACAFEDNNNDTDEELPPFISVKHKLCQMCNCTFIGEHCILCLRETEEHEEGVMQDSFTGFNDDGFISPFAEYENIGAAETNDVEEVPNIGINQPIVPDPKVIKIHRMEVKEDLLNEMEKVELNQEIKFVYVDSRGKDEIGEGSGVSRDVYTTFWQELAGSYFIGEDQRVPFVRHDMFEKEWENIGKIIVKGFNDTGFFPIILSEAFVLYCLFGSVERPAMLSSFSLYLSFDERELVKKVLQPSIEEEFLSSEEFLDFLDQFKCRSKVTKENVEEIIYEIARQELLQKPHIMATCWKGHFAALKMKFAFSTPSTVHDLYEASRPTAKRNIDLFKAEPKDDLEKESFGYLKRYVRGLNSEMSKKFLKFITGSDTILVHSIQVEFKKFDSSYLRRPIVHTCIPILELPSCYANFCELREEFASILTTNSWQMDII